MIFTYSKKQVQWKPNSYNNVVPKNSKPLTNKNYDENDNNAFYSPFGKARPMKHYRKQIKPFYVTKSGNAVSSSRIDAPNGTQKSVTLDCNENSNFVVDFIVDTSKPCIGTKFDNVCKGGTTTVRRPGKTVLDKNYHTTTSSYLKSKCVSYNQRSVTASKVDGEDYAYNMTNCNSSSCNKTYYKPSNAKYHTQGAVSSSCRLLDLKVNTITKNANSVKDVYGVATANALNYTNSEKNVITLKAKDNMTVCNNKITYPLNMRSNRSNKVYCS